MDQRVKAISSSLEKIRGEFDPACSYMIFEKPFGAGAHEPFEEVVAVLERLDLGARQRELFRDDAREKWLLVVKFDPDRTDEITQEFVRARLPEEIVFFVYGSPVVD